MFNLADVTLVLVTDAKILINVDMEARERIKKAYSYLRDNGIVHTQQDVANIMSVKKENISRAFNGHEDYLTSNFMERFNNAFNGIFNIKWLQKGEGNMLKEPIGNTPPAEEEPNANYRLVPIVHIDSVGGLHSNNAITDEPQYVEGYVPFVNAREGDKAIYESGNSMIPTIPPGSLIQVRKVESWREYFGYGNIYVIELTDGRQVTKEVAKYEPDPKNYILCKSHNPDVDKHIDKQRLVK